MKVNQDFKNVMGAAGGAIIGGVAMKKFQTAQGTPNPIVTLLILGGGIFLVAKGKGSTQKSIGYGLASVGSIGTAGKIAEKIQALKPFTPSINGTGEIFEDENGNVWQMDGLSGEPQLVQDEFGNSYMVNGFNGDEDEANDIASLVGLGELEELV